jgi:hypothetical protein
MDVPYSVAADYRIPITANSLLLREERKSADAERFEALCKRLSPVPGAAVEEALLEGDVRATHAMLRHRVDWTCCAPWVSIVRSQSSAVLKFALEQPQLGVLINRGYALREAVILEFNEAIQRMLELEHVDPNLGGPLHRCAVTGNVIAAKMLCAHPKISVNAFTPANGTTALCQAIISGWETVFCCLLAHPRIDVNRGFLYTPLQLCVWENRVTFVQLLISRPALLANKASGATVPPLWMAFENDQREIATLLLRDTRVDVSDGLIDALERSTNVDALQLIAEVDGSLRWGVVWRSRRSSAVAVLLLTWVTMIS